ncbi:hypothetical protein [Roseobacter sp. HKCCD7870]|uniref:hypothetical protein n=1 Tax=Roseobacter sp. HKCCD7870 TaxID=3120343 RepID=UPI0030EC047F
MLISHRTNCALPAWTGALAEGDRFTAGWATSVLSDNNHNGFVGFGISAEYQISGQNFIEASFMP